MTVGRKLKRNIFIDTDIDCQITMTRKYKNYSYVYIPFDWYWNYYCVKKYLEFWRL